MVFYLEDTLKLTIQFVKYKSRERMLLNSTCGRCHFSETGMILQMVEYEISSGLNFVIMMDGKHESVGKYGE